MVVVEVAEAFSAMPAVVALPAAIGRDPNIPVEPLRMPFVGEVEAVEDA